MYSLGQTVQRQQQLLNALAVELEGNEGLASISASLRDDLRNPGVSHPEVVALLRQDKFIAAVNRHRELTGAGLAEAKHLLDAEKSKYL